MAACTYTRRIPQLTRAFRPVALSRKTHHHHQRQYSTAIMDYNTIPTPPAAYADFCMLPIGTGSASVASEIAEVQKLLKASGLKYTMHSAGTTVEGSWDEVFNVIGRAHTLVHQRGVVRIQTSMRAGTRTDKKQTAEDKVSRVEGILAEQEKQS